MPLSTMTRPVWSMPGSLRSPAHTARPSLSTPAANASGGPGSAAHRFAHVTCGDHGSVGARARAARHPGHACNTLAAVPGHAVAKGRAIGLRKLDDEFHASLRMLR